MSLLNNPLPEKWHGEPHIRYTRLNLCLAHTHTNCKTHVYDPCHYVQWLHTNSCCRNRYSSTERSNFSTILEVVQADYSLYYKLCLLQTAALHHIHTHYIYRVYNNAVLVLYLHNMIARLVILVCRDRIKLFKRDMFVERGNSY